MIRCIAIDDEPQALDIIKILTSKIPFADLTETFRHVDKAYAYIAEHKPDVVFLDINIPDVSGVEFAKMIPDAVHVIFTTAYSEYALESYEVEATDYLLKPIGFNRLLKSLQKVQVRMSVAQSTAQASEAIVEKDYLFIKSGTQSQKVLLRDIQYIESDGNYLTYVTKQKKIISRINMTNAMAQLPAAQFIRVHKSYIISFQHIQVIDSYQVNVAGREIPIGSSYREAFKEFISGK